MTKVDVMRLFIVLVCSFCQTYTACGEQWKQFESKETGLSIRYPGAWSVWTKSEVMALAGGSTAPKPSFVVQAPDRSSFYLVIHDVRPPRKNLNEDEQKKYLRAIFKEMYGADPFGFGRTRPSEKFVRLAGVPAVQYTFDMPEISGVRLVDRYWCLHTGERGFLIGATTKKADFADVDKQFFTPMAQSLRVDELKVKGARQADDEQLTIKPEKEKVKEVEETPKPEAKVKEAPVHKEKISVKPRTEKPSIVQLQPDGKIILVDEAAGVVHLNIGTGDRVYRGLTFSVYDRNATILEDGKGKAEIEVFDLTKNISAARIVRSDRENFIAVGDIVANLIWDSSESKVFVVAGEFDLDSDGSVDHGATDRIRALIEKWGGSVTESISTHTDFVVLGQVPRVPFAPTSEDLQMDPMAMRKYQVAVEKLDHYKEVQKLAQALSIPVFTYERFLYRGNKFNEFKSELAKADQANDAWKFDIAETAIKQATNLIPAVVKEAKENKKGFIYVGDAKQAYENQRKAELTKASLSEADLENYGGNKFKDLNRELAKAKEAKNKGDIDIAVNYFKRATKLIMAAAEEAKENKKNMDYKRLLAAEQVYENKLTKELMNVSFSEVDLEKYGGNKFKELKSELVKADQAKKKENFDAAKKAFEEAIKLVATTVEEAKKNHDIDFTDPEGSIVWQRIGTEKVKCVNSSGEIEKKTIKYYHNSIGMKFVYIEPGKNLVSGDVIENGFYISATEVTQKQWTNGTTFSFKGDNLPADKVSWLKAVDFCKSLVKPKDVNGKVRGRYTLPTEAQWEYACRAGTATKFYWGDIAMTEFANINFSGIMKSAGSYPANMWGIYDMYGNVEEWCRDKYDENQRVIRGGSYRNKLESSNRGYSSPRGESKGNGFRIVIEIK